MKITEFLKSKCHQCALQDLCNQVLLVSLSKNFFHIPSWAEDCYCCHQWEPWWWLDWKQESPSSLASCDVWQADLIQTASTFSLAAEIASILLQGNNNLQIKLPKCCTFISDRKINIPNLKPVKFLSCCVNYHDVWQNIVYYIQTPSQPVIMPLFLMVTFHKTIQWE